MGWGGEIAHVRGPPPPKIFLSLPFQLHPPKFFCLYNLPPPKFFLSTIYHHFSLQPDRYTFPHFTNQHNTDTLTGNFIIISRFHPKVFTLSTHRPPDRRYQNSVGSGAWFLADKRRLSVLTPVNPIRLHVLRSALSAACLV